MEYTLTHLIDSLESTLKVLEGPACEELENALHDHDKLPDKNAARLASRAVDLLHKTEQLLEPGSLILADHFFGHINSKCLNAAVELNVPDALRNGPQTLEKLAADCKACPDRLQQILRILYNNGIFSYNLQTQTYANNSTSMLLLSDHWTQWKNWVDLYGNEFYDIGRGIPASCRENTKRIAAQINFDTDKDMFSYFAERGWLPRLHKTLSGGAIAQAPGILQDYPWESIADKTFLDIGGGSGGLVALILRKHKNMRAGILDLQSVIDQADTNFHALHGDYIDVGNRVPRSHLIAGDFLKDIPAFEVYTMKWCLHDWNDTKALKVMSNIRKSIIRGSKSRLLIFESLLTDGHAGRLSRYGDVIMMVSASGQERSRFQWQNLAKQTGWVIQEIYSLRNAWVCAIELLPDWGFVKESVATVSGELEKTGTQRTNKRNGEEALDKTKRQTDLDEKLVLNGTSSLDFDLASTQMTFLEPWDSSHREPFICIDPSDGFDRTNIKWVDYPVTVCNARPIKSNFDLDIHGFAYRDDPQGFTAEAFGAVLAANKELIQKQYYPEVERLIRETLGASRIIIFDHTIRKRNPKIDLKLNEVGKEQPATMVHCDQSVKGALNRVRQNIGVDEDIEEILKKRVRMINLWRPLRGPVTDWPLATMDFQTLQSHDIHPCNLLKGHHEYRGQTIAVCHSQMQRWYYLNGQTTDEVTMIKIWDNKADVTAKLCAHTAFKHPDTPVDAHPQESIEVRCIVIQD